MVMYHQQMKTFVTGQIKDVKDTPPKINLALIYFFSESNTKGNVSTKKKKKNEKRAL